MNFEECMGDVFIKPTADEAKFVSQFSDLGEEGRIPVSYLGAVEIALRTSSQHVNGAMERLREARQLSKASSCMFTLRNHVGILSGAQSDIETYRRTLVANAYGDVFEEPTSTPDNVS